ncbi:MAG: hypothetical protein II855_04535 [Candidatus Methanomethylophilaceae archaeon]|nr:hypothetical protein [Candidatus Methanomethylophilaceae archaeon]
MESILGDVSSLTNSMYSAIGQGLKLGIDLAKKKCTVSKYTPKQIELSDNPNMRLITPSVGKDSLSFGLQNVSSHTASITCVEAHRYGTVKELVRVPRSLYPNESLTVSVPFDGHDCFVVINYSISGRTDAFFIECTHCEEAGEDDNKD